MTKTMTKIDPAMLGRENVLGSVESVYDAFHKVYLYNPWRWQEMDPEKAGKFRIREANSENDIFVDSIDFNLLETAKVRSGKVVFKDEFGDAMMDSKWEPLSKYYYSNEYPTICSNETVVWLRAMWRETETLYFKKWMLNKILTVAKLNWELNQFSEIKNKMDWGTYRVSHVSESTIMFGKFLSWDLEWEYFIFYPKDNAVGFNYSKWEKIEAKAGTLTRVLDDALPEWNKIREANKMKQIKNMPVSLVDLKISSFQKEVMEKEFNIAKFDFLSFAWERADNSEDIDFVSELRASYFNERFWGMKEPISVVFLDKLWNETNDPRIMVDCRISYDFSPTSDNKQLSTGEAAEVFEAEVDDAPAEISKPWTLSTEDWQTVPW